GDAEALRGDARAGAVEDAHRDLEALPRLAQKVVGGNADIVERELAGRRAADAHLRLEPPDLEARRVGLEDEGRDACVAGPGGGLRGDRIQQPDPRLRD